MPEAKMRKYVVTLGRRVKNIDSTLKIIVEATHRRKAAWVAEHSTNKHQTSADVKKPSLSWQIVRIEMVNDDNDLPNDIDVEGP